MPKQRAGSDAASVRLDRPGRDSKRALMTTGARSNELEDPDPLQLTDPEMAAVTDEAHRLGYRVSAHAEGVDGCAAAIRHGVDTVEHGMYLHSRPDLLDAMAAAGQVLVPTLSGYYWMSGLGSEVIDPAHADAEPDMPPVLVELAERNLREGAASMRAARDAGVKIALGSDTSLAVGLEFQRMVYHGLTPAQALVAATKTAAEALGLDEHIGTVEQGKLADLIIVDGDPLAEPRLLSDPARIWLVLQLGVPVAGELLANPALAGQFTPPDRPAAPRPADMEGWIQHGRSTQ